MVPTDAILLFQYMQGIGLPLRDCQPPLTLIPIEMLEVLGMPVKLSKIIGNLAIAQNS